MVTGEERQLRQAAAAGDAMALNNLGVLLAMAGQRA